MCKSIIIEMLESLLEGRQEWKKELAMMTKEESEKAVNEITEAFKNNLVKEINNMNTNELFDIEEVIVENQRRLKHSNELKEAYEKGEKGIQEIFTEKHNLTTIEHCKKTNNVKGIKHSIRKPSQISRRVVLADMCQDEQESDEYLNAIREQVKAHDEKGYDYHITNSILY